jgi:hypothetical protein
MRRPKIYLAIFSIILVYLWLLPDGMLAQEGNQAALVIRHSDQSVQTACVDFSEPEISGLELLQRSGINLELDVQGLGAAVCRIGQTGCPANDCWCQCKGGGDCIYWSYWLRAGGQWQYSQGGASTFSVNDGEIQGWSWGPGAVNQAYSPPDLSFKDVCTAAIADDATATPKATALVFIPADTPTGEMNQSHLTETLTSTPMPTTTTPPTATNALQATIDPTNTPLPTLTATVPLVVPAATQPASSDALGETEPVVTGELTVAELADYDEQVKQPTATWMPTPSPMGDHDEVVSRTPEAVIVLAEPGRSLPIRHAERENKNLVEASEDQLSDLMVVGTGSQIPDLRALPLAPEEQLADQEEQNAPSSLFSYMIFGSIVLGLSGWLVVLSRNNKRSVSADE